MRSVLSRPRSSAWGREPQGTRLLVAGAVAFAVILGLYVIYTVIHAKSFTLDPVDLAVYRSGGFIVRHLRPDYNPHLAAPLYDWPGYGKLGLQFTYTPFAAVVFAVISVIPWSVAQQFAVGVNLVALLAAVWLTLGGLGYRKDRARAGLTLLGAAALLWTEPVLRTIYLGQVNLVLMALIIWDLCQPDTARSRWWKGFVTGLAAGVKLVPLIFIPYLLVTRRYRQALTAAAGFVVSMAVGFVLLPADSAKWWFDGLFFQGKRTGFTGWAGNQSLQGLITRLAGSINGGKAAWAVAAVIVVVLGMAGAALLDRAGHQMPGLLLAALTGLLVSPISWDHHWVWIVPGAVVAAHYAVQAWRQGAVQSARRRVLAGGFGLLAAGVVAWFGAWPTSLFGAKPNLGNDSLGLLWIPHNTSPVYYIWYGDQRWFPEYHWRGLEIIAGNAYVLAGLGLFGLLLLAALLAPRPAARVASEPPAVPAALH